MEIDKHEKILLLLRNGDRGRHREALAFLFPRLSHEERPREGRGYLQEVHGEENQGGGKVTARDFLAQGEIEAFKRIVTPDGDWISWRVV